MAKSTTLALLLILRSWGILAATDKTAAKLTMDKVAGYTDDDAEEPFEFEIVAAKPSAQVRRLYYLRSWRS